MTVKWWLEWRGRYRKSRVPVVKQELEFQARSTSLPGLRTVIQRKTHLGTCKLDSTTVYWSLCRKPCRVRLSEQPAVITAMRLQTMSFAPEVRQHGVRFADDGPWRG